MCHYFKKKTQNFYETCNFFFFSLDLQNVTNSLLTGCERQTNLPSQQQLQHQMLQQQNSNENSFHNSLFGTNMSKFFDFHKNQQQKMQSVSKIIFQYKLDYLYVLKYIIYNNEKAFFFF